MLIKLNTNQISLLTLTTSKHENYDPGVETYPSRGNGELRSVRIHHVFNKPLNRLRNSEEHFQTVTRICIHLYIAESHRHGIKLN